MSEHFFRRWSRRKHEAAEQEGAAATATPVPAAAQEGKKEGKNVPTLQDVAALAHDSDFSRFLASGIDPRIRRAALKKLFSDPHFNRMDGLDVYIDDYTKTPPLTEAMRATLAHVGRFLDAPGEKTDSAEEDTVPDANEAPMVANQSRPPVSDST